MSGFTCNRWCRFFLIVGSYLATGEPALLLAQSSGYATPVFPPAGIAVAFCFAAGFETLPAIFVGAFLLNFWIGFSKTFHFGAVEIASGLSLAAASALQAAAGGWALRRFIGYPAPLDRIAELARFLAIAPLVCLTSASLSTLALYRLGAIAPSEFVAGWGAWWLGDTLGVVTIFPLVMVAFGEPREIWKKRALTVAVPMIAALAMFVLVFLKTSQWEKGQALSKFRLETQEAGEAVEDSLNRQKSLVEAIGAMMDVKDNVSEEEFERFCRRLQAGYPAIRSIGFAGKNAVYLSGHGIVDHPEPAWLEAGERAGGKLAATQPRGSHVFLLLEVRGRGTVFADLEAGSLLHENASIYARLEDAGSGGRIYDTFPEGAAPLTRRFFDFGERRYLLETAPSAAYLRSHRTWQSWAVLASGVLGSAILGGFLLLGTGYTDRIEREVASRTEELRRSELRYRQIFETNAAVKLVIDPKSGKIVDANPAAENFYGYPREKLLSMGIGDINTLPLDQIQAEADRAATGNRLFNFKHRTASGEIRDVEVYSGPVELDGKMALYSIVHDITDRKRSEESLLRFTSIFEASSEAVMVVDRENRIVTVNPAFTEITGYAPQEAMGMNPSFLSSGRHGSGFYRDMWRSLETFGRWQGEIWDKRKNGEVYPEWLTINTIYDEHGNVRERVAIFSDITKNKEAEAQVWRQANFDELTGLPNRNMFRDRLDLEIRKSHRSGLAFALFFIDLDRFKEVNDTLGHETGDRLLVEAANRIDSSVREGDTVARLGGDEFTVILTDLSENAHVERVANTIIQKLAEPFRLGEELAYVSGSIGITLFPFDASQSSELLKNADQAMYYAKSLGKNRFAYFTPALQEAAIERMKLIGELRNALPERQLTLAFQPIVSLATGKIVKAEALLRWKNSRQEWISPADFIPLAEETGLIHEIGDWVFREAASWAMRWRNYDKNFQVSINLSPVQLMARKAEYSWVDHLRDSGLSGRAIVAEITEGVLLNASQTVEERLIGFRDAGIQIAIDDFGMGYSALAYLKKFDIDYLKIDKSFIAGIDRDKDDLALSRAIVAMAHSLSIEVVAEGVETEAQRAVLPVIRCDYAQGYLYAKPLPPEELEKQLKESFLPQHGRTA